MWSLLRVQCLLSLWNLFSISKLKSRSPTMVTLPCLVLSMRMKVMALWLGKKKTVKNWSKNIDSEKFYPKPPFIQISRCSRWGSKLPNAAAAFSLGRWQLEGFWAHHQRCGVPHGDAHRSQEGRPHRRRSSWHVRRSCRCRPDVRGCFISCIFLYSNSLFRSAMRTTKCWPPSLKVLQTLKTSMPSSTCWTPPSG